MEPKICFLCNKPIEDESHGYYPDAGKSPPGEYGPRKECHFTCVAEKCFSNWKGSWS